MRGLISLMCGVLMAACAGLAEDPMPEACGDGEGVPACGPREASLAQGVPVEGELDAVVLKANPGADNPMITLRPTSARKPVVIATDGEESTYVLPIRDKRRHRPRAILSVRLDDLQADERVKLFGEVQVSFCDDKDRRGDSSDSATTPCTRDRMVSDPYRYTPRLSAALVVSKDRSASGVRVSPWTETACGKEKHHCTLVIPEVTLRDLPVGEARFVHLVVTADARGAHAKSWHVMEVERGKGRLTAARLHPDVARIKSHRTRALRSTGPLGIDQTPDEGDFTQVQRVVYRQKLTGLRAGDLITVDARMKATLGRFPCDPLIATQVLLTDRKGVRAAEDAVKRVTARNGFNCRAHGSGSCEYAKSGALRLSETPGGPLWITWVAMAKRSCAAPGGRDKWEMRRDAGGMDVAVFR